MISVKEFSVFLYLAVIRKTFPASLISIMSPNDDKGEIKARPPCKNKLGLSQLGNARN